jgi:hypothetical protein
LRHRACGRRSKRGTRSCDGESAREAGVVVRSNGSFRPIAVISGLLDAHLHEASFDRALRHSNMCSPVLRKSEISDRAAGIIRYLCHPLSFEHSAGDACFRVGLDCRRHP